MRYLSTRGGVEPVGFADAVMMGLATDGGLLLPTSIPQVSPQELRGWSDLSFQDLAFRVMQPYVQPDLDDEQLRDLIERSFATFSHPDITPVVKIENFHILELFHGPTAAFKDVALQFLGNLFDLLLEQRDEHLNILGATSGDTGSAAIYGVRGSQRIDIFILHPHGRVSAVQERQMTTVLDENVHNLAIRGTFDDGQRIVKELFNDLDFKSRFHLGAVNSINWARILAQIVYYFYAWGRVTGGDTDHRLTFSVPTGNFGDIFAGYLAMRMGLPVERLVLATNRNDILSRFVNTGIYAAGEVHATISPSMDIQISSNFERYLYYLMDEDPTRVVALMKEMAQTGSLEVSREKQERVRQLFSAMAVSEELTQEEIRRTWKASGYILDPHTAVGVAAARDLHEVVCLATAHPAKFPDAVREAIGEEAPVPPSLSDLMDRETRCAVVDATTERVREVMQKILADRGVFPA